jgi:hypothetical protein
MQMYEHPQLKGFFLYPIHSYVYVNKDGEIYNEKTGKYGSYSDDGGAYPVFTIRLPVHRIMAETFLDKPEDIDEKDLIVNHLDGDKRNPCLSNLEWTTYSGNNIHAYKTGLRPDNQIILLKEIGKDEIQEFYSLQEAARYLSVNGYKVHAYLKNRFRRRPLLEKYLLTYKGEEWPNEAHALSLSAYNCGLPTDIVVIDTEENKTFVVEGYENVANLTKIGINTLRHALRKARPKGETVTIDRFKMCYLEHYQPYIDSQVQRIKAKSADTRFKGKTPRTPKPIMVTNLSTHETYRLDSSETLAKQLGVKKNTLQKHIWMNKGIWKGNLKVEYLQTNSGLTDQ